MTVIDKRNRRRTKRSLVIGAASLSILCLIEALFSARGSIDYWRAVGISLSQYSLGPPLIGVLLGYVMGIPRRHRVSVRRKRGLCPECGYDLRGQTNMRCPECGISFADNLSTTAPHKLKRSC